MNLMSPDEMGGGGPGAGAGIAATLMAIANAARSGPDREKIKRLRSLSPEQLLGEPESVEKQIALQELEELGRTSALPPERIRKYSPASEWSSYDKMNPLGDQGKDMVHRDMSLVPGGVFPEPGHNYWRDPSIESWVRSLDLPEDRVAFEIQKHKKSNNIAEQAAIEAFLQQAMADEKVSVGVASPESAAKAQGHMTVHPWMQERYKERYPELLKSYTGIEPEDAKYFMPMDAKKIEENLLLLPWVELQKRIREGITNLPEYTPVGLNEPAYFAKGENPLVPSESLYADWEGFNLEDWKKMPDQVREKYADTVRNQTFQVIKNLETNRPYSDTNYGRSEYEGRKNALGSNLERIDSAINLSREAKDKLKKDYSAWWEMYYHLPKDSTGWRVNTTNKQNSVEYKRFKLDELRKRVEAGENPWIYLFDQQEKK